MRWGAVHIGRSTSMGPSFSFEPSRKTYGGRWLITHPFGTYPPPGSVFKCSRGRYYRVQKEGNIVRITPPPGRQVEVPRD